MTKKKLKKDRISFRLPDDLEEDFRYMIRDLGAKQTDIIIEALRARLPEMKEELRRMRAEAAAVKTPAEKPR